MVKQVKTIEEATNLKQAFSWSKLKERALQIKIRRAKIQAKTARPDFALKHKAEVQAATKGDYTELILRVTKEVETGQQNALYRREKLAPE